MGPFIPDMHHIRLHLRSYANIPGHFQKTLVFGVPLTHQIPLISLLLEALFACAPPADLPKWVKWHVAASRCDSAGAKRPNDTRHRGHPGRHLGAIWVPSGAIGCHLGAIWVLDGFIWVSSGCHLVPSGCHLSAVWVPFGCHLVATGCHHGTSWVPSGVI